MSEHTQLRGDSRGLSTPVTHTLSIAITALLIIGLLAGVSGELDQRRQSAATEELRTIGHKVVSQFEQLNASAATGGSVSTTLDLPADVVGRSYSIRLIPASDCSTPTYSSNPDVCVRLRASSLDMSETIPVQNSTMLSIDAVGGGSYRLSARGSGVANVDPSSVSIDETVRVGITNVRRQGTGTSINLGNQPPLPTLQIRPGLPRVTQPVVFDASNSKDDGKIVNYTFLINDGPTLGSSPTKITKSGSDLPLASYTPPPTSGGGFYSVQLYVTDNQGATQSTSVKRFKVAGLQYNDDYSTTSLSPGPGPGSDQSIEFSVTNRESDPINITHVFLNPESGSVNMKNPGGVPEVEISDAVSGSRLGYVNYGTGGPNSGTKTVPADGLVVDLDHTTSDNDAEGQTIHATGTEARLNPGQQATIELGRFQSLSPNLDEIDWRISVRYEVDSKNPSTPQVEDPIARTGQIFIDNGDAEITSYNLRSTGSDVDLVFDASKPLSTISVDVGTSTGFSDTLTMTNFTNTSFSQGFRYRANVTDGISGTVWANLTQATTTTGFASDDVGPETNESTFVSVTGYTWLNAAGGDPDSLVAYYSFDGPGGSAQDRSNNNYNTGNDPGVSRVGSGRYTAASEFDPSGPGDGFLTVNGLSNYLEGTDSVTIAAWIKADSPVPNDRGIFTTDGADGDDNDLELRYDATGISSGVENGLKGSVRLGGSSNAAVEAGTTSPSTSNQTTNWQHVVLRWSAGDHPRIYANGTELPYDGFAQLTNPGDALADLGTFRIGGPTKSNSWDGKIDDLRVYDTALSDRQIKSVYKTAPGSTVVKTTSWRSGGAITGSDVVLDYTTEIEYGNVDLKIEEDTDGDGVPEKSTSYQSVSSGSGTISSWTSNDISDPASKLRVKMRLNHVESTLGPGVRYLNIREN